MDGGSEVNVEQTTQTLVPSLTGATTWGGGSNGPGTWEEGRSGVIPSADCMSDGVSRTSLSRSSGEIDPERYWKMNISEATKSGLIDNIHKY